VCTSARSARNYVKNRESILRKQKEWQDANKEKLIEYRRRNYRENIEKYKAAAFNRRGYQRVKAKEQYENIDKSCPEYRKNNVEKTMRWQENNPEKVKCHKIFKKAVNAGRLIPQPCEECGSHEVVGHHEDYSKPLEVIWLCDRHHKDLHNLKRELYHIQETC